MSQHDETGSLSALIERGGVYRDVPGSTPREAITGIIQMITLPPGVDRERLLAAALEREALMSTAVGKGIALPHPRNPIITRPEDQLAAIACLRNPVNWNALDGQGVHTAILIVSASAKLHLHTLSRVNFFCRQETFYTLLQKCPSRDEIVRYIRDGEQTWGG